MASSFSKDTLSSFPCEILENIFQYLVVEDLCHVALCSRSWREAANSDVLWRPLCRKKGWERYGTVTDLCKEVPLAPAPQEQDKDKGNGSVSFPDDLVVTASIWPGLTGTCKWKEIYMKARHLEANWRNNRYHVVSFEFGSAGYDEEYTEYIGPGPEVFIRNMDGEGNLLACGVSDGKVQLWDVNNGQCRHIIEVDVSDERHALKMKNGVIAVGCKDGKIRTYSAQTGEQLHVLSGHRLEVSRLFFDGETIVSASAQIPWYKEGRQFEDSDIRVWSSADGSSRFVFQSTSHGTQLVHLDFLDKTVAGAYDDNTIRLWDVLSGTCKRTITTGTNKMISCHLGDGIVISVSKGNDIRMWNLDLGECIKTFDVPGVNFESIDQRDATESCAFSGELFLTKTLDENIRMFNLDGKFVGDTRSQPEVEFFYNLELICIHGNNLVTAEESGGNNYLWTIDRRDGFTFVKELRHMMYDDEMDVEYSMAWMSDTKLAFVHYYDFSDFVQNQVQIPKILVHHYW